MASRIDSLKRTLERESDLGRHETTRDNENCVVEEILIVRLHPALTGADMPQSLMD